MCPGLSTTCGGRVTERKSRLNILVTSKQGRDGKQTGKQKDRQIGLSQKEEEKPPNRTVFCLVSSSDHMLNIDLKSINYYIPIIHYSRQSLPQCLCFLGPKSHQWLFVLTQRDSHAHWGLKFNVFQLTRTCLFPCWHPSTRWVMPLIMTRDTQRPAPGGGGRRGRGRGDGREEGVIEQRGERRRWKEGRRRRDKFVSRPTLTAVKQTHMGRSRYHTHTNSDVMWKKPLCKPPWARSHVYFIITHTQTSALTMEYHGSVWSCFQMIQLQLL